MRGVLHELDISDNSGGIPSEKGVLQSHFLLMTQILALAVPLIS